MIKYLICLLLLINFFFPGGVLAVTEISGEIQVTHDSPLFPASISWYPGLSVTKSFVVKNLSSSGQTVYLEAFNTLQTGDVDKIFLVNFGAGEKTLRNFWNDGPFNLSDLAAGATSIYNLTIRMATSSGNVYQMQDVKFDLLVGFLGTNNQVTVSAGDGGGNPSAPVCNDTKPGSAPTLTNTVTGTNSVTLFWSAASSPVTYYLVTYGVSPGAQTYGNPNVGGAGTTSYIVTGLSGGTTYYFKVRAGNGCMLGDFSNELSTTPTGGFVSGPAAGFIPGVLGTQENLGSGSATVSPELVNILGAQVPWWQWIFQIILQMLQWLYEIFRGFFAFFYAAAHE